MESRSATEFSPMQAGRLSIFERYRKEYATYGFAISHFSHLEQGLLSLFMYLDDRLVQQSIGAYWQIGSCRGRYDWIDKRIKGLPPESQLSTSWLSTRERLETAIELRNQLAHGEFTPIMISPNEEIVGYWARLAKNSSTGKLSFNQDAQMIEGAPFFSPAALIDLGLNYIELSEILFSMSRRASQS